MSKLNLSVDEVLAATRAVRKRLDFERAVPFALVRESRDPFIHHNGWLRTMMLKFRIVFTMALLATAGAAPVAAQSRSVASESRDSAAAFVETQNYIVGRIGRECLEALGRSETPAEYRAQWQRRNARYYDAATKYMAARLAEIDDPAERDGIERAYYASVNQRGEAATTQMMLQGTREEVCPHVIALIDAGKMDIEAFAQATKQSVMEALTELGGWAERR